MANIPSTPNDPQEPRMPGLDELSTPSAGVEIPVGAPQETNQAPGVKDAPSSPEKQTPVPPAVPPAQPISSEQSIPAPQDEIAPYPAAPSPSQTPAKHPWYRSNRMFVLVLLFFCLGGISTLVPVGKIPFLRSLVYAMGLSAEDAQHMSFLRALLSWQDDSRRQRALAADGDELSVFNTGGFVALSGEQPKSKLISVRSVNAALERRGRKGDDLTGSYDAGPLAAEKENDKSVVRIKKNDVTAATQANNAKNAEVFFGEDSTSVQRDKNDAFNSVNMLQKVTNKPVGAVSGKNDWFNQLQNRGVVQEFNFDNLNKALDSSNATRTNLGDAKKLGDTPARRNMYYIWLTSRAARQAKQPLLKKTLASAGFEGADMPKEVISMTGFGGVSIKSADVVVDMENVKKYLELDKQCQDAIKHGGEMAPDTTQILEQVNGLAASFPKTCGERNGAFDNNLQSISNVCQQMKRSYEQVKRECNTISIKVDDGQCKSEKLSNYSQAFDAYCEDALSKCASKATPEEQAACVASAKGLRSSDEFYDPEYPNIRLSSGNLQGDVDSTFYDEEGELNNNYFAGIDWGGSLP